MASTPLLASGAAESTLTTLAHGMRELIRNKIAMLFAAGTVDPNVFEDLTTFRLPRDPVVPA